MSKAASRNTNSLPPGVDSTTPRSSQSSCVERGPRARDTVPGCIGVAHSHNRLRSISVPVTSVRLRRGDSQREEPAATSIALERARRTTSVPVTATRDGGAVETAAGTVVSITTRTCIATSLNGEPTATVTRRRLARLHSRTTTKAVSHRGEGLVALSPLSPVRSS